jgi:hypothetical protein
MVRTNCRDEIAYKVRHMECTHYERGGTSDRRPTCVYDDFKRQCLGTNLYALVDKYEKWYFLIIEIRP